ncbi:MAG TPA: aldo/keto reductase [Gemmatimonadota bacterium]|nr:aldo/keto reductase [Gemmatimonadota bacterium]
MEYRRLGGTWLDASVIGFGCNRIGLDPSPDVRREVVATLEQAFAQGINLFDTANSYRGSERLLGRVFRSRRHEVLICSKAGYRSWRLVAMERVLPRPFELVQRLRPARRPGPGGTTARIRARNFDPRLIRLGVEGSLRRLATNYLDIFYLHSPPAEVVADDRVLETLQRLQEEGSIRHYGISFSERATSDEVMAAMQRPGMAVIQLRANPLVSVDLERIGTRARELRIAIVARQAFERGRVFGSATVLTALAGQAPRTPAQAILRSVLQRPGVASVLVGMRTRRHLDENVDALAAPSLDADELQRLYATTRIL